MRARLLPLALLATLTGCVTKTLFIESTPPGAAVRLDGRTVGTTPYSEPIAAWGVREIALELDGHVTRRDLLRLERPWWQTTPIDLFVELMVPWTITYEHREDYALEPRTGERAAATREDARAAYARMRALWAEALRREESEPYPGRP